MLKLISREDALKELGRKPDSRMRNYEIEHYLDERTPDNEWVIQEWCPFNGIHCKFFEYSDKTWLLPALEAHRREVKDGRMHKAVLADIKGRLKALSEDIPPWAQAK